MAKLKTTFFCQNCGAQSAQWMGKCKSCGEWNTIVEEVISKPKSSKANWENETAIESIKLKLLVISLCNLEQE